MGKADGIELFKVDAKAGITVSIEINKNKEDIVNNEHYFASSSDLFNKIKQLTTKSTENLDRDKKEQNFHECISATWTIRFGKNSNA